MGQPIVLDRIPAGSASCQSLQWRMWWKALAVTRPTAGSFLVHTNLPWDAYCASLSGRFRKKLAANRSKAGRAGAPVRFSRIDAGPDEVAGALALFTDVESRGWKARHGTALALRPDLHRFFQLYTERAAARRRLRVSVVWIDERPAAVELGLEAYGRMWSLKIGYDERFAAFSPGTQLVHASIGAAHQSGLTAYEFLGAAEPWQKRWRPHSRGHQLVAIYPIGPRAMATACRDVTGHLARRIQTTIRREEASPLWRPALDDTTRV
jgi:CelD/BcsL family acetyltransferase involved in cellulose biosynthesis